MSNELREAAKLVCSKSHTANTQYEDAALRLARKYIAEHPEDDEEPKTREWLVSLPGAIPNGQYCYFQCWKSANFRLIVQSDLGFVICAFGQSIRLKDEWTKSRGDVRRLCKALGIPLQATGGASPASPTRSADGESVQDVPG